GYPPERLALMQEDAGVRVLLTQERVRDALDPSHTEEAPTHPGVPPEGDKWGVPPEGDKWKVAGGPENLAYVIYTSGSTGRPKGVAITHRSAVVMLQWAREVFSAEELAGVLASTSICFDLSVFELFAPLSWGGRVILVRDALELPSLEAGQEVRLINTVPSAIAELIELQALPSSVRTVNLAGEVLKGALVERIYRQPTIERVLNLYGPSEDTTYSSWALIDREGGEPTIGWPVSDTGAYVLDRRQRPVAIGLVGELYLGGAGLARGYLDRPRRTAESFVPNPFRGDGTRLYRTGDRARRLGDGTLEFLGRLDHQIKMRGFRIELGEIEAMLSRSPSVRECAVLVREASSGDPRLVAYVAAAPESAATPRELRALLREKLPDYMVPSAFVVLDALPLTPNRKVDRTALARLSPEPDRVAADLEGAVVAPRDLLELQLTRIWEELLGVEAVGIRANFFDLGGHSLLAVRLMARIRRRFGSDLPLATLFHNGTVERLAAVLRRQAGVIRRRALVAIRPEGSRPPVFCVHPVGGDVLCYGDLARHLGPEQPFYGLQVPDREGELFLSTIEEMAEHYVEAIREVQPEGPYRLGGWSMGGLVALEMAHRLMQQGQGVERLVLIDAAAPAAADGGASELDDARLALLFARDVGGLLGASLPVSSEDLETLATAEEGLAFLYEKMQRSGMLPPDFELAQIRRLFATFRINRRAMERYVAPSFRGPLVLFKAGESPAKEPPASDLGWGELAEAGVEVYEVPGNHYSMMREPNVHALAKRLAEVLDPA
ncbi:MAG: amino acid adenylation domain-containing protein, partial [bacterium]|nr:amino acid adenylation domain-containing protein [bacterium]